MQIVPSSIRVEFEPREREVLREALRDLVSHDRTVTDLHDPEVDLLNDLITIFSTE